MGTLYGKEFDSELKRNVRFVIADTRDIPEDRLYSKERTLIEEIKGEVAAKDGINALTVHAIKTI